jgi:translation initiation factor IF-2
MTRKRIQELAKEWGVTPQAILAQLEKIGISRKTVQSSLSEDEMEKVKVRLGLTPAPPPVVGKERLVSERVIVRQAEGAAQSITTKEQVIESQVRTGVIRRRTTRIEVPQEEVPEPSAPFAVTPPVAFELAPVTEPLPRFELPAAEPDEKEATTVSSEKIVPHVAVETRLPVRDTDGAATVAEARPSRILGHIDLRKVVSTLQPQRRPEAPRAPVTSGAKGAEKVSGAEVAKTPPPKRTVIRTPEVSELSEREARLLRTPKKKKALPSGEHKPTELTVPKASKRVIKVAEVITVSELAKAMGVKAADLITQLMRLGMLATVNQVLDVDTATLAAAEFDYTVENVAFDVETLLSADGSSPLQQAIVPRAPVVTVMGHVDHGKTSLLDAIRHTNITAREAGGITQHMGAYAVEVNSRRITFLDTPGHEAFTAMRARGAQVTDIVVLVVAADEGVMPQTIEAINHARAAGVPFVVALTKIDKPEANVERVKKEVASYGVVPEDWGGDALFVPVSAKTGEGVPSLLEMILLQADVLELKAALGPLARGVVVEAKLDKGRGPVATVLVQEGMLKVGDPCVCGIQYGKVRALFNSRGQRLAEACPATPVEVLGLNGVPAAGDTFVVARDDTQARQVAEHRQSKQRTATLTTTRKFSLADLAQSAGERKELRVVIKADVQGSVEALSEALQRLSTEEVRLAILHASVGGISESDVLLAVASDGLIIGFQVRPEAKATKLAEREGVEIRLYSVIYDVLADVRAALEGLLRPVQKEKVLGRVEVRQVFTIPRVGVVAGGLVKEGKIPRGVRVRLIRDHTVVYQGRVASLRRFKEDVREVVAGYECGVGLENFQDLKAGDVLEAFELEQVARRLELREQQAELRLSA